MNTFELRRLVVPAKYGLLTAFDARPASGVPGKPAAPLGTVVIVPWHTDSKEEFMPLVPHLVAGGYRVCSYDQAERHRSTARDDPGSYRIDAFVDDLRTTLTALDAEDVHLVGNRLGGLITAGAVLANKDRFVSHSLLVSEPANKFTETLDRIGKVTMPGVPTFIFGGVVGGKSERHGSERSAYPGIRGGGAPADADTAHALMDFWATVHVDARTDGLLASWPAPPSIERRAIPGQLV